MPIAEGLQQIQSLRDGGFTDSEIDAWRTERSQTLIDGGFNSQEVDDYFGVKTPNMTPTKQHFEENLKVKSVPSVPDSTQNLAGPPPIDGEVKPQAAKSFMDSVEAGWQMSVAGLLKRGQNPEVVLPEDAPRFYRIASGVSQLAGDLPAMAAGSIATGTAAAPLAAASGVGAPLVEAAASGYGAFALPAAMRKILMDHYEKGDIQNSADFWDRASSTFIEANKQGFVGAVTGPVGIEAKALAPAFKTAAQVSAEVATMTTLGKAVEGQIPNANDFIDGAILVGGLHAAGATASKLRGVYKDTGIKPEQVLEQAQTSPTVKQDILKDGTELPEAYKPFVQGEIKEPPTIQPKVDAKLTERSNALPSSDIKSGLKIEPADKILERITPSKEAKDPFSWDRVYTNLVDDLHPLKQFTDILRGEKVLGVKDDPYALSRLTRGAYGKADQFLEFSPFKFDTLENTDSKPLKEILNPFKDDLDGLRKYAVSSRALELEAKGIKTGVPLEDAQKAVKEGRSKYEKGFQDLVKYQNDTLAYLKDSGIISKDAFGVMTEANKSYVPFFRLIDEKEMKGGVGSGLTVKNPVKSIKGSEKQIIDPIESIIKNTYTYIQLAERNRVLSKMVDLSQGSLRGEELMQKVPTPMRAVEVKGEEFKRFLNEHGIPQSDAEAFTIFRPDKVALAKDEIQVFRNGKREIYKVPEDVAQAIKGLDRESVGFFTKLLSYPASTLRAGSTLSPDFMVRNFSRDMMTAFNLAKGAFTPLDTLSALGSLFKKDEHYQNWLKSGAANSNMVSIDRAYIDQNVFKLSKETGLMSRAWNVITSPLEALRVTSELIENSNRLAEFKRVAKGSPNADAIFKGGMAAREVTLDFQRIGAKTRGMNTITAFWNAQVQGLDKVARTLQERPLETAAKLTASITMPSIYLWFANKDDERWKEIPRWQKDLFWIVMTDDHIYRIPKPQELGLLFGSLPERVLESYQTDNPNAFKDFSDTFLQAFSPSYVPTAISPIIEHFANKSLFTGHALVSSNVEGLLPEYQYNDYTSETGKILGKFVQTLPGGTAGKIPVSSPAIIDNYIRAWSGTLGGYALKLADEALIKTGQIPDPVKPASTLEDLPVVKAFLIRYPSANAQSIQDFYSKYEENKKVLDTIKYLGKNGDLEGMQKVMTAETYKDKIVNLDGIRQALTTQSQFIRLVTKNPDITPDEKRQLIDGTYMSMIQISRNGNDLLDELGKSLKESGGK